MDQYDNNPLHAALGNDSVKDMNLLPTEQMLLVGNCNIFQINEFYFTPGDYMLPGCVGDYLHMMPCTCKMPHVFTVKL